MSLSAEALDASAARDALSQRLRAAADALGLDVEAPDSRNRRDSSTLAAAALDQIGRRVADSLRQDEIWLLLTCLASAYPTLDELTDARRALQLGGPRAVVGLLEDALVTAQRRGDPLARIRIVTGGVLADVEHSAKEDLHTGIQRVARNLLPAWQDKSEVVPAVWTDRSGMLRQLRPEERRRTLQWGREGSSIAAEAAAVREEGSADVLLVPWRSVVLLVEVPSAASDAALAAVAARSGNRLAVIGYDAIPVISADLVPPADCVKFATYLSALKYAHAIAAISESAATEFRGFCDMLPTQGLAGPSVRTVMLPDLAEVAQPATTMPAGHPGPPLVLMVGSFEPRKNHLAVLHAAEQLWREGLEFQLRLIGGSGWGTDVADLVGTLSSAGRPIEMLRSASELVLRSSYREAAFTVFPSLHEGYGLPVAESFAFGTPVLTSSFGAPAEIAAGGGALTVDPRDDLAVRESMRTLLTEPDTLARLRRQISDRTSSDWHAYANELWQVIDDQLTDLTTAHRVGADSAGVGR